MDGHIESAKNPRVKELRELSTKKGREEQGAFLAEGRKLLQEAVKEGLTIRTVLSTRRFAEEQADLLERARECGARVFTAERVAVDAASDTKTPQEVVASVAIPTPEAVPSHGLIAALDAVQDPGNVGAILRSADAMGAAAVLLGPGCADPWSPKAMRASMGSALHLPVISCAALPQEIGALRDKGFLVVAAHLRGNGVLPPDLGNKVVLLIGNEGNGLSDEVSAQANLLYRLEMKGRAESLNAAVCAGILLYELSHRME